MKRCSDLVYEVEITMAGASEDLMARDSAWWSALEYATRERNERGRPVRTGTGPWPPLQVYLANTQLQRCLYFTKDFLPGVWARDGAGFPTHTDVLVWYGLPNERVRAEVKARSVVMGAAVLFVGDLDPLDIAAYLALSTQRRSRRQAVVRYGGIDDEWLASCRRHLGGGLQRVLIRMDPLELRQLTRLEATGLDLPKLVGSECAAILRAGHKVEIEGATNPAIYGRAFHDELRRMLLGRSARTRSR